MFRIVSISIASVSVMTAVFLLYFSDLQRNPAAIDDMMQVQQVSNAIKTNVKDDDALFVELSKQKEFLDTKEHELKETEQMISASMMNLDNKIIAMQKMHDELSKLIKKHDEYEKENLNGISVIYQKMAPKDAASVMSNMEVENVVRVLKSMKHSAVAAIFQCMRPDLVSKLTIKYIG